MKYTRVTKGNLPTIYGWLKSTMKDSQTLTTLYSYYNTKRVCNMLRNNNLTPYLSARVEESFLDRFHEIGVELELNFCTGNSFIRIHNNDYRIDFSKSFLIPVGAKICFTKNKMYIKSKLVGVGVDYINEVIFN